MATFSTVDALASLCASVPEWNARLDELNGQIASRQIELARLEEERPAARSLRNKDSTESLRPKDGIENNVSSEKAETCELIPSVQSPKPIQNEGCPKRLTLSAAGRAVAVVTPPPPPKPQLDTESIADCSIDSTIVSSHTSDAITNHSRRFTETKTASLASGDSAAPKRKTRSMIIVYYDSAVQVAFEDLVKFVSGSRNTMRKGKMAAKMVEMRRAAELEAEADE